MYYEITENVKCQYEKVWPAPIFQSLRELSRSKAISFCTSIYYVIQSSSLNLTYNYNDHLKRFDFRLGKDYYKSKIVYETLNPKWYEQFDLYLYDQVLVPCLTISLSFSSHSFTFSFAFWHFHDYVHLKK